MSGTNKEYYISKLIVKSVLGTLSSEENIDFDNWYSVSENREFYHKIIKEENFEHKILLYKSLNKNAAYSRIIKRIEDKQQSTKQKLSINYKNAFKYAAAAILLISIGYYSASYFSSESSPAEINDSVVLDLKPGYEKATLVLEDGTEVNLEKNEFVTEQASAEVKNQNNSLVYKENKKGKISSKKVSLNTLFVPIGGMYNIVLSDGTKVWLNSSSSLKYPTSFEESKRIVELSGEGYFEVKKDVNKSFVVKTKTRDISVLGTSFNVSAYQDDDFFAATLAEGKIKLLGAESQEEVYLSPGEQAVVSKQELGVAQVNRVNPEAYSAWREGTFFFKNKSLGDILKKVGRWYNFKVDFSNQELSQIKFTGLASKDFPAKRLLDRISKSANVTYEIIKNTNTNEEYLVKILKKEP
ncbi:hypothetical protein APS56_14600 [Pseudalgibacter alginicilyticus]|uniref:Iron dicitrate transport regulator FecR n=1 Tax=Pseudalgibacter alginicilyticus TaxID=1736674 RepID=A0A0P0D821_9FLAO|nr:FecR family protein [Pseudalgibacter alginicilyticus]ALJ06288.1 hypothetical protein APS56_14600 [Pseudalgibacter alginicilyticus]